MTPPITIRPVPLPSVLFDKLRDLPDAKAIYFDGAKPWGKAIVTLRWS